MQDTRKRVALVVGATGLSGSYTGRLLKQHGWTVVTLSRGAAELAVVGSPHRGRSGGCRGQRRRP